MAGDTRQQQEVTFKILVLGDASVGKTSLIHVFCDGALAKKQMPTIGKCLATLTLVFQGQCKDSVQPQNSSPTTTLPLPQSQTQSQ